MINRKESHADVKRPNMSIKPMLNIREGSGDGRYTLVIQLIRERRRGVIFTPYRLLPGEFDAKRQKAVATSRQKAHTAFIREINVFLERQKKEIAHILSELEREGRSLPFGTSPWPTASVTTTTMYTHFSNARSRSCAGKGRWGLPTSTTPH